MSEAAKKPTAAERAWAIRRARVRRILRNFAIFVGVPTLLAIIYYTTWAADEYVSVTVVSVQSPPAGQDEIGGSFVANRPDDAKLVRTALRSRSSLEQLIAKHEWREHYVNGGNLFSSLSDGAGSEESYSYYQERVAVRADKGQAVRIRVRAFSPDAAAAFSSALLAIAEKRLNEITLRPLDEQSKVAAKRLAAAKERLAAAEKRHAASKPDSARATPDAPPAAAVHAAVPPELIAARDAVVAAEALVDKLALAHVARRRYLTVVSGPSVPNEAAFPRRLWSIATVFVIAFALMGVIGLLLGAVREHAKV